MMKPIRGRVRQVVAFTMGKVASQSTAQHQARTKTPRKYTTTPARSRCKTRRTAVSGRRFQASVSRRGILRCLRSCVTPASWSHKQLLRQPSTALVVGLVWHGRCWTSIHKVRSAVKWSFVGRCGAKRCLLDKELVVRSYGTGTFSSFPKLQHSKQRLVR